MKKSYIINRIFQIRKASTKELIFKKNVGVRKCLKIHGNMPKGMEASLKEADLGKYVHQNKQRSVVFYPQT